MSKISKFEREYLMRKSQEQEIIRDSIAGTLTIYPKEWLEKYNIPTDCQIQIYTKIGKRVRIGSGVMIKGNVTIKDSVTIGNNVVIEEGVIINENSKIGDGAYIGKGIEIPFRFIMGENSRILDFYAYNVSTILKFHRKIVGWNLPADTTLTNEMIDREARIDVIASMVLISSLSILWTLSVLFVGKLFDWI